jgi:biotin carboxylase
MKHVVFVDSTASGLLAFRAAKKIGCYVTFIKPLDSSFVSISFKDDNKLKPHLEYVDQYLEIGDLRGEAFHALLENIHGRCPIDAIISTSEAAIVAVAREAERFGTLYPGYEALCNAVFKNRCRSVLKQAGIRSPDFEVLSEGALIDQGPTRIRIPFVVKPTRGFGKQFSAICKTPDDFVLFTQNVRQSRKEANPMIEQLVSHEYIVEEYIDGSLHSVEVIVRDGKVQTYATTVRFRSYYNEMLEMTATMPSGLSKEANDEMKAYVQQVFSALKLDMGVYHVELLRDARGPCLVEINARMMGSVAPQMYRLLTGIDPFELMVRLHLGEPVVIDDSHLRSAGTVVTVASRYNGKVSMQYDNSALEPLLKKYDIGFSTLNLFPGREVGMYEGNLSVIGHVIVTEETPLAAARKGHRFLCELENFVGIELGKYFDPATFETVAAYRL